MIMGYEEAKQVDGRFYEFAYRTIVNRTPQSEHFGCFKGNNLKVFILETNAYFWNEKCFEHMLNEWNRNANGCVSMYEYHSLGQTERRSFTATEALERIYARNNFKYLAHLVTFGSMEYIS